MQRMILLLMFLGLWAPTYGVELAPNGYKAVRHVLAPKTPLSIYKDPALFIDLVQELQSDPALVYKLPQRPLLKVLDGPGCLVALAPKTRFQNLSALAEFYALADSVFRLATEAAKKNRRPWVIPVKLCGDSAYADTLGFVLADELERAIRETRNIGAPRNIRTLP